MSRRHSSRRRGRGQGGKSRNLLAISLLAGASLLVMSGAGVGGYILSTKEQPDEIGCLPSVTDHTMMLVDVSPPAWGEGQRRDIKTVFDQTYRDLKPAEKLTLLTTEGDQISSLGGNARVQLCKPATGSDNDRFNRRLFLKVFEEQIEPIVEQLMGIDQASRVDIRAQMAQSPLLETFQSVSKRDDFSVEADSRKLVIVSDMLQSTEFAEFCFVKGHLPPFEKFKERADWFRMVPDDLFGTEVEIYLLVLVGYGTRLPFCNEKELHDFWTAYFKDAGAASVVIHRLRPDVVSG
ncbi:MAG: hypothetical protein AAGA97_00935 [Pseudomonadota bacterium]